MHCSVDIFKQLWLCLENSYTVFTRISTAAFIKVFAPQMRRLFEGGAYLKIGRNGEIL